MALLQVHVFPSGKVFQSDILLCVWLWPIVSRYKQKTSECNNYGLKERKKNYENDGNKDNVAQHVSIQTYVAIAL